MSGVMNAKAFKEKLSQFKTEKELNKVEKFFNGNDGVTKPFGVTFGNVFRTAKEFKAMPLDEIEKLLESDFYEIRMGAVSIMDYQAKDKKTSDVQRKRLFNVFLSRLDRLKNWDFVDRVSASIMGAYLIDKSRDILYKLASRIIPGNAVRL